VPLTPPPPTSPSPPPRPPFLHNSLFSSDLPPILLVPPSTPNLKSLIPHPLSSPPPLRPVILSRASATIRISPFALSPWFSTSPCGGTPQARRSYMTDLRVPLPQGPTSTPPMGLILPAPISTYSLSGRRKKAPVPLKLLRLRRVRDRVDLHQGSHDISVMRGTLAF